MHANGCVITTSDGPAGTAAALAGSIGPATGKLPLRCDGLITPGRIELSAGAGIVAGSTAAHEFDETEAKLGTMLAALRDADAGTQQTGTRG